MINAAPCALLLVAGVALFSSGCTQSYRGGPIVEPMEIADPQVKLGQIVFYANCQQCHPEGGRGIGPGIINKPLPDWSIRLQVRYGVGQMPAFSEEQISDTELDGVVAYLNALRSRALKFVD